MESVSLYLDSNLICSLSIEVLCLEGLNKLKWLGLQQNRIKTTDLMCLSHLKRLEYLDLSDNLIDRIGLNGIDELKCLKILRLNNNQYNLD